MLINIKRDNFVTFTVSIVIFLIVSGLFFLLTGNENLDTYKSVNEIVNNGELNCNQHYWTLTNNINNFGEYEIILIHRDIYIFPEIENLFCLGKVITMYIENDSIYIVSGTNQKVFNYLTTIIFLFFSIILYFYEKYTKLIISIWTVLILFVQIYLFSSFKNPVTSFLNLSIIGLLLITCILTFRNSGLKKYNFSIIIFSIVVIAALILDYIYIDYLIYLSIVGFVVLKSIQKIINLKYLDIFQLICLSHIGLVLGGVDYPFSRNHLNYLPSIINKHNSYFFDSHYLSNIAYPYPLFEKLMLLIFRIFGLEAVNFLNYFSYFFGLLVIFIFVRFLFEKNWILISLSFSILSGRLAIYSFLEDSGWDKKIYENSFIKLGIGENPLITHLFEPTTFDVLILLVIVFLLNKNTITANLLAIVSILIHTYNVVPIFLIFISYLFSDKKNLTDIFVKLKNSSLLLFSLPIIYLYNIYPFTTTLIEARASDAILTHIRIPMHRLFSGRFSLFGESRKEYTFDFFQKGIADGFHFELEFFIFALILFYLIKNKFIKNIFFSIFYTTILSLTFVFLFQNNVIAIYMKNIVPWRTSVLMYLLGIIYLLNFLYLKMDKKFSFFTLVIFIILNIFALSDYAKIDKDRLRKDIDNNIHTLVGLNLINPLDDYVIFGNSQEINFNSTTENYYAHPYKALDVIDWYNNVEKNLNFFESNPSCDNFQNYINDTGAKRALFSSIKYVPDSVKNCKELKFHEFYQLYFFEN